MVALVWKGEWLILLDKILVGCGSVYTMTCENGWITGRGAFAFGSCFGRQSDGGKAGSVEEEEFECEKQVKVMGARSCREVDVGVR